MTRINTNVSSLIAQTSLGRTNDQLQTALNRLSTGLRINSGADDPAGLIASENLGRDITASNKAISNSQQASELISTADSALGQINTLLNNVRGLVTEAASTGVLSTDQIAANQLQVDSSLDAIDRISAVTTFQGRKLLDGSLDFTTSGSNPSVISQQINRANLGTTGSLAVNVNITQAATQAQLNVAATNAKANFTFGAASQAFTLSSTAANENLNGYTVNIVGATLGGVPTVAVNNGAKTVTLTLDNTAANTNNSAANITAAFAGAGITATVSADLADTDAVTTAGVAKLNNQQALTFQLSGSKGSQVFSFSAGTTFNQIATAVNLVSDAIGVTATVSSGVLNFKSTDYGSAGTVKATVISEATLGQFGANLSGSSANGVDIAATVNGFTASGKGNTISLSNSVLDFSSTVTNGSSTALNFTITGGGALFQIGPNVNSGEQSRIGLASVNTGSLGGPHGRLYELRSGNTKALNTDAAGAALVVDDVINKVTTLRGRLGAFQQTTLQSNIASLKDTVTNLTAAQSSIRDADFAAESANLTRAQILAQSGTQVLQISNQRPQQVLALLKQ